MKRGHACRQAGFSLIEILVSIGVIAILGLVLTQLLTRTLRGGSKTQLIGTIKQSGQVALSNMDSTVRGVDNVICPGMNTSSKILVIVKNGTFLRFWFYTPLNQNGYIASDNPTITDPRHVNDTTLDLCAQSAANDTSNGWPVNCTDKNGQKISCTVGASANKLTDPVNVSLIGGSGTSFTRTTNPGFKDVVNIQFDLGPSTTLSNSQENQVGATNSVHFNTSVELR